MPVNLTPAHLRCSLGGCPSVTRLDDGRLMIVGASAHDLAYREDELVTKAYGALIAENKIADDETVVVISPDLLADLPEILHLRSQVAKFKQALEAIERKYQAVMASPPDWVNLSEEQLKWVREAWYGASLIARAALTEEDKESVSGRPEASPATQGPEN